MKRTGYIVLTLMLSMTLFTACRKDPAEENGETAIIVKTGESTESAGTSREETTAEASVPERPSYYDEDFFTNEEKGKSFDYRYNADMGAWEAVFTLYDVNIVREMREGGKITLEYEGKSTEVPWAVMDVGTGQGMSYYLTDVTGDGFEELVFLPYIREHSPVFVFDLKNWRDLSPFYCLEGDLYKGLYTYPEFSGLIEGELNAVLEGDGYGTVDLDEISKDLFLLNTRSEYGENGIFSEGAFLYKYYRPGVFENEWWCLVRYSFTGGECTAEIIDIGTKGKEEIPSREGQ